MMVPVTNDDRLATRVHVSAGHAIAVLIDKPRRPAVFLSFQIFRQYIPGRQ
jgi:hypothetical protein